MDGQPKRPTWTVTTTSAAETQSLASDLGARLEPGAVVALTGDLGAGKTCFVQGLAKGLGVAADEEVVSPTYALVNEYPSERCPLIHVDFYRLEASSITGLGIEETLCRRDAVKVVEWADLLAGLLPADAIWIRLEWVGDDTRRVHATGIDKPGDEPAPRECRVPP